jgi:hypothetical protein
MRILEADLRNLSFGSSASALLVGTVAALNRGFRAASSLLNFNATAGARLAVIRQRVDFPGQL